MFSMHIGYELKEGNVSIDVGQQSVEGACAAVKAIASDAVNVEIVFESSSTGAFYETLYSQDALAKMCPLLALTDELVEMLNERPTVSVHGDRIVLHFWSRGRSKTYPIDLELQPREYPAGQKDLVELRAENRVLRRRFANLEARLEEMHTAIVELKKENAEQKSDLAAVVEVAIQGDLEIVDEKCFDQVLKIVDVNRVIRHWVMAAWCVNLDDPRFDKVMEHGYAGVETIARTERVFVDLFKNPNALPRIKIMLDHGFTLDMKCWYGMSVHAYMIKGVEILRDDAHKFALGSKERIELESRMRAQDDMMRELVEYANRKK